MDTPPAAAPTPSPPPPKPGVFSSLMGAAVGVVAITTMIAILYAAIETRDLARGLNEAIEVAGGAEFLTEPMIDQLVDRLTDSGFGSRPIDPDDPMIRRRTILVTEGMNEQTARYVAERLVYLNALDPAARIDLRLATSGGWLDAAFLIVDTMRSIEAPVDVTAVGGCYSAGTVVLAAATGKRRSAPNAVMSVHVNDYDPSDELSFDQQELRRFRELYARYTRVPREWFGPRLGDNQYYLNAEQALEMDLIDEITEVEWERPEIKKSNKRKTPSAA